MKIKFKVYTYIVLILILLTGKIAYSQNILINGDFESGNIGFTSDYNFKPISDSTQGIYGIINNPNTWLSTAFSSCSDHTSGSGNMMVADGATIANTKLWEQTVTVVPNQAYVFQCFLQTIITGSNLAQIEIEINGVSLGFATAPASPCAPWVKTAYSWFSGVDSSAKITIYDRTLTAASNDFAIDDLSFTACTNPPPIVTTPVYLCQNKPAISLTAAGVLGSTLVWYGTSPSGGTGSSVATIPSIATVGQTTYYVSQTDGLCESTRAPIVVNVVADNGATILGYTCDSSQILSADKNSSVYFDWSNNPLISDNSYNYSYTIQGGTPINGNTLISHLQVFGMQPGQTATLTLTAATHPCATQTWECTIPCGASTVTPTFAPIPTSYCINDVPPVLSTTSTNSTPITGTWSPSIINTATVGTTNYIFTPDPILFPCALAYSLPVTVTPLVIPTFATIPTISCQNAIAPVLPLSSNNATSIAGTWSPAVVNTAILGSVTYAFTPNSGQCTSTTLTKVTITILPNVTPDFAPIPTFCSGTTAPVLVTTSPNGITGTWSPMTISNTANGSYLFTPNPNQCAATQTLNVTIKPKAVPNFALIPSFCSGTVVPILGNISPNGITGTWFPPTISNTNSGSYLFTPNLSECATTQTLNVVINPLISPSFADLSICEGTVAPILQAISPNGIIGTWSPPIVDNVASGTYVFTPNVPQCAVSKTINVTVNPSNTIANLDWTVTDAFAKNQIIIITDPIGANYLYQLDYGPFQASRIFENVASGTHSITVKNINGCSELTDDNVLVVNYPKYFTPNGDGFNDTWNIYELSNQLNLRVYIFDRYGKLLKDISPNGSGWDGTYIGQPMPADDYWFTVEYMEQGVIKKFKSHFSLKR